MDLPVFEHARWLAEAWRHGKPIHNLGASGFQPSEPLAGLPTAVADEDLSHLDLHQETAFRDALAGHLGMAPDEVRVAAGTSAANAAVVTALVSPGDHVVCERPTYMPLPQLAQGLGAQVSWVDAAEGFDPARFADACTDRTRLILLTSPNNPTGHAAPERTLAALGDIAAEHGAHVVADQVYRELTDHPLGAAAHPAVLSTGGFNKCWGAPGLRVGWIAGDARLMQRIEDAHRLLFLAPPSFGTRVGHALLEQAAARRAALQERLATNHRIYETWCDRVGLDARHGELVAFPHVGGDTLATARDLLRQGILTVPGQMFGQAGHLRLGLGIAPEALQAGLEALGGALERAAAQRL